MGSLGRPRRSALIRVAAAALLGACAGAEPKPATRSVALLPMANESIDVEAPAKVRRDLAAALKDKGYTLVDISAVDSVLKERFGVTDGGQLRVVTPEKLKGVLPGDLWAFGEVKEYTFKSAAALSQRKVVISMKVIEAATGKTIYEDEETGITTRAGVDAAGDTVLNFAGKLVKGVTGGSSETVADTELKQETREAAEKLLEKFPR